MDSSVKIEGLLRGEREEREREAGASYVGCIFGGSASTRCVRAGMGPHALDDMTDMICLPASQLMHACLPASWPFRRSLCISFLQAARGACRSASTQLDLAWEHI